MALAVASCVVAMPYVIRILVASGDPDGLRVVEKSNWTGQGVVFPRAGLRAAIEHGLSTPGIYVLIGSDPDGLFDRQVYIGQGEDVGRRLQDHARDDSKEFWEETVVFLSTNNSLNRALVLYLESTLVRLATEARQARIANGNRPVLPSLSASDRAEAEGFVAEMLNIFPVLGLNVFDLPRKAVGTDLIRYRLSGPDALGFGEERSDGFLVFAGATARIAETSSLGASFSRLRARLLETGAFVEENGVYRLTEDTLFKSPSTAAMALLSRNANGRTEWRDEEGVTLKERQAAAAESAGAVL